MGYTGQTPTAVPLTSADIADGTITNDDLAGSISNDKLAGSISNDKLAGSIANSKLATDPTNASNLASGTVPTARLGSGTASSSTFLRGDQTYAEAGGGAWSVTASGTFSGSSTANFTVGAKPTKIYIYNFDQSTGDEIEIRFSSDGGSSFDSGASDYRGHFFQQEGGNHTFTAPGARNSMILTNAAPNGETTQDTHIEITTMNPSNASTKSSVLAYWYGGLYSDNLITRSCFQRNATADIDAIQLYASAATFSGSYVTVELN